MAESLREPLVAAGRDVVVDVGRVDVAAVAERDAHLRLEHRQVEQPGDALDSAFAPGAQGQVGAGVVADQVVAHDLGRESGVRLG